MRFHNAATTLPSIAVRAFLAALSFAPLACDAPKDTSTPTATSDTAGASSSSADQTPSMSVAQSTPPPGPSAIPAPDDVAAAPADAQKTASGLASKVLTPGTGKDKPGPNDKVSVNYTGWTAKDGKMFDSSVTRGKPADLTLDHVIKGWTEGLQLMVKGEKRRMWIPAALAYGDRPHMGGAPSGDLTFDVELVDFTPAPKPPPVPDDVKAAPASAKKTTSGLQYRVLTAGKGAKHPASTDHVTVNYSGWTPDGKMFDSSITRGEPTSFGLDHVIKGWTEGVQLMVEGDKYRFWIPADLAYGDHPRRPGTPSGPLVFDIELLSIK